MIEKFVQTSSFCDFPVLHGQWNKGPCRTCTWGRSEPALNCVDLYNDSISDSRLCWCVFMCCVRVCLLSLHATKDTERSVELRRCEKWLQLSSSQPPFIRWVAFCFLLMRVSNNFKQYKGPSVIFKVFHEAKLFSLILRWTYPPTPSSETTFEHSDQYSLSASKFSERNRTNPTHPITKKFLFVKNFEIYGWPLNC